MQRVLTFRFHPSRRENKRRKWIKYPFSDILIFQKEYPIPLYIRDDSVDTLAAKVQAATGVRTKTEAVRLALEHELTRIAAAKSFDERNVGVMAMADALGPSDPAFDMKAYTDEMWGDI